ncbi:hypothetical protein ACLB2K_047082 [Fragaria x ananassa]
MFYSVFIVLFQKSTNGQVSNGDVKLKWNSRVAHGCEALPMVLQSLAMLEATDNQLNGFLLGQEEIALGLLNFEALEEGDS